MTTCEVILSVARHGYTLEINRDVNQIRITVKREEFSSNPNRHIFVTCSQILPDDHIYDSKLADCIIFCLDKAQIEFKNKFDEACKKG